MNTKVEEVFIYLLNYNNDKHSIDKQQYKNNTNIQVRNSIK